MPYQYKSGSQKRKEKQIRENARDSGQKTLESIEYFIPDITSVVFYLIPFCYY